MARTQTAPMHRLAMKMRKKEEKISPELKSPSRLLKITNKIKNVAMPDSEVARAIPAILRGNISRVLKVIFIIKAANDTFVGVRVSLRAKKHDCKTLVEP